MWKIQESQAELQLPGLSASLDLGHPEHGVSISLGDFPPVRILAVVITGIDHFSLDDCYVRSSDLVASYSAESLRLQIYWRAIQEASLAGIDTIVSLQTDDLGRSIETQVITTVPDQTRVCRHGAGAVSFGIGPADTYVQLAGPATDAFEWNGGSDSPDAIREIRQALFREVLERGVIRRARMRGAFVHGDQPTADPIIEELVSEFENAPPPLTT